MPLVGFEPKISAGERPAAACLLRLPITRSVKILEFIKTVEVVSEKSHFSHFFLCDANVLMHQGCSVIVCNRAYQDDSVILKFKFNLAENCTFHVLGVSVTMVTLGTLKYR